MNDICINNYGEEYIGQLTLISNLPGNDVAPARRQAITQTVVDKLTNTLLGKHSV